MNRRSFLSFLAPLPLLPLLPMLKLTRTINPMEFQKGQKVVCVDSEPHLHPGIWSRSKPTPISQHTALPMVIPPELIVATLIGSLVVGVVSAIAAVVRVLRIDPAAVLLR